MRPYKPGLGRSALFYRPLGADGNLKKRRIRRSWPPTYAGDEIEQEPGRRIVSGAAVCRLRGCAADYALPDRDRPRDPWPGRRGRAASAARLVEDIQRSAAGPAGAAVDGEQPVLAERAGAHPGRAGRT